MTEGSLALDGGNADSVRHRRIGLIGGMSWESTALYYRLLNEGVRERRASSGESSGHDSAEVVLHSVNFAEIVAQQESGDWAGAGEILADAARGLTAAGAELLLICANTMHKVADAVTEATDVPLLHVADVVAGASLAQGIDKVGLLATRYTMEDPFYADRLSAQGVCAVVPDQADRDLVHSIIYDELVRGVFSDASRRQLVEVIDRMRGQGVGGVVLGCTEIELLLSADDVDVPVFATTELHCAAALYVAGY